MSRVHVLEIIELRAMNWQVGFISFIQYRYLSQKNPRNWQVRFKLRKILAEEVKLLADYMSQSKNCWIISVHKLNLFSNMK